LKAEYVEPVDWTALRSAPRSTYEQLSARARQLTRGAELLRWPDITCES